jgi:predicted AlkP superfamily phosphohydrolase/phosphomutase
LFGNIFINLKGREPDGIINQGKEYEDTVHSLIDCLLQLKDPDDGNQIVTKIYRSEELYYGPYVEDAPDLILIMRNYRYMTRGGYEFRGNSLFSKPKINHSGNHRINGIAFFYGPNIKKGGKIADIHIIDLMPTILSIMDIPIPDDVDGRAVTEVLA